MADGQARFSDEVAAAALHRANEYLAFMERQGVTFTKDAETRFRRIMARAFTDGALWIAGGMVSALARDLADMDQIDVIVTVHHDLSDVLHRAGLRQQQETGGSDAGQDDPGAL